MKRLTYANVMATVALFFALTGGAVAAGVKYIVATDSITQGDLAGSTYGSPAIAAGKVTTGKIADGAVTSAKLADGAVTPATALNRITASSWNGAAYVAGFSGQKLFYDRTLPVNTSKSLYVTVTGTGRQENGDVMSLLCQYSGHACDAYGSVRVGYTGNSTWPNNSFTQTWCVTADAGTQRLQLSLVPLNLTNTVYIEHVNVTVDGSDTPGACSATGFQTP